MELWIRIGDEKLKLQGSFRKVMEDILTKSKNGKKIELLSFHTSQKERRRLKRELRANNKDIVETARAVVRWFYTRDFRSVKRRIKELKKRARYLSKGEYFYCSSALKEITDLENKLKDIEKKLRELKQR